MAVRNNVSDIKKELNRQYGLHSFTNYLLTKNKTTIYAPADDAWWKYNKSKLFSSLYKHNISLLEPVMLAIKPIYIDLTNENLLKHF